MPRPQHRKENTPLLPSTQPDSVPFLLTRPNGLMTSDVIDDDAETTEIPASRSVPPHAPPAPVVTTEHELPSVIVEEVWAAEERETSGPSPSRSDVDSLLTASETLEFPLPEASRSVIPVTPLPVPEDWRQVQTEVSRHGRAAGGPARRARVRAVVIAAVAALTAAGGTFVGLKVFHVSAGTLNAALHVVR
jgi:hypothetical protein